MNSTGFIFPETTTHLRRLESGLVVPATTGTRTFVTQRDMFLGGFDEDFTKYGTDIPAPATATVFSNLYEITKDGYFRNIISSFSINIEQLFWRSQDQILAWIENYPSYLHSSRSPTFFPFLAGKRRFVASVRLSHDMLVTYLNRFDSRDYLIYECYYRLVFPSR